VQLHRDDVVAAATAILDNYGMADLTMRRLARELDISPGGLYWHFANKQQLLGQGGWRHRIHALCGRVRDALLSHTDGAELVSASFAAGQSSRVPEVLGLLADAAIEAGLDSEQAALAARTLIYYVLGATADEQSRRQWVSAGALADAAAPVAGFEFGLRLLTDGLAVRSTPDRVFDALVALPPA
jgi:TetR/AcrR family tetracycline transcriptional repressor